ncbi:HD domain-containing protein [Candidatus Woesearchaeota archaeon]|nr:HD domain-containing protein [Candidatus Woesearchaeota archaeon]
MDIVENARRCFNLMVDVFGSDPYYMGSHVPEMERWAHHMLKRFPEADEEIVLLSVWLHDIGHYPVPTDVDHAVRGVERSREFLERKNYDSSRTEKILHCVRAHRCRDVMPETIEAKIIAFTDSASHMTDQNLYLSLVREVYDGPEKVIEKLERDYRDLELFPEIKEELKPLYEAWKRLLINYGKANRILED